MPTLRFRRFDEIPPEDQEQVALLRTRMLGRQGIDSIWGAQAHWPAHLAANHKQALATYQLEGVLLQLGKEAVRVAARQPCFLASTWAEDRLVLGAAELDEATKACVAVAVATLEPRRPSKQPVRQGDQMRVSGLNTTQANQK